MHGNNTDTEQYSMTYIPEVNLPNISIQMILLLLFIPTGMQIRTSIPMNSPNYLPL